MQREMARTLIALGAIAMTGVVADEAQAGDEAHPGVRPVQDVKPAFPLGEDVRLPGLVDVKERIPEVVVDLKYASTDNFMKADVYGGLRRCFLVPEAAEMLAKAHAILKERAPSLTFVMFDCARPRRVQRLMWEVVKGTPSQSYVANPYTRTGSLHNYGCAADMSLYDLEKGEPVDMGTPYDYFGKLAEPRHELTFWKQGKLKSEQLANRLLLREVMLRAGWHLLRNEWWHFNCADNATVRRKYAIIE